MTWSLWSLAPHVVSRPKRPQSSTCWFGSARNTQVMVTWANTKSQVLQTEKKYGKNTVQREEPNSRSPGTVIRCCHVATIDPQHIVQRISESNAVKIPQVQLRTQLHEASSQTQVGLRHPRTNEGVQLKCMGFFPLVYLLVSPSIIVNQNSWILRFDRARLTPTLHLRPARAWGQQSFTTTALEAARGVE